MAIYLKKHLLQYKNNALNKELQLAFLNRLLRLLKNGYPLLEALDVIKWDKHARTSATIIAAALTNGQMLDKAFEKAGFSHLVTSYLYFARTSGNIQNSIEKCIYMYEQRINYSKKFQQATRYPLILLFVFSILLFFIKQSVLPSFTELFLSHSEASRTIRISIMMIDFLSNLAIAFFITAAAGIILWQINKRKISIEKQIKYYSHVPIYRKYKQIQTSFLFATHFSSLLKTGMSIKEILLIMSQQKKLPILAYYSTLIAAELNKGFHITNLLAQFKLFEKQLVMIFQKNTDKTALEKDLSMYAELLTDEMHRKITKVLTYIQPVVLAILALFIIFIYITLMWPMFQLIETI